MCGMCPDVVDGCDQIECGARPKIREDGTRNPRYMRWFTIDEKTWCKHLTEEYGTDSPALYDHVKRHYWEEEDWAREYGPLYCEDQCWEWGYTEEAIMAVVEKLREKER